MKATFLILTTYFKRCKKWHVGATLCVNDNSLDNIVPDPFFKKYPYLIGIISHIEASINYIDIQGGEEG